MYKVKKQIQVLIADRLFKSDMSSLADCLKLKAAENKRPLGENTQAKQTNKNAGKCCYHNPQ